ncbi:MAG: hypothetical protein BWK76_02490 [Desulfobulbaceae bacterium A2]|nr:MAG: hypothetical protein BWK76_02490 [Desulfobulbaceae bacterium A2]
MQKNRLNVSLDSDLIEFLKDYAVSQRTTVSEVLTQFVLKLKRVKENDPSEIILADPDFSVSLDKIVQGVKCGTTSWKSYDEVFG